MTNADKIRSMTDEELAAFFSGVSRSCQTENGCITCPLYHGCARSKYIVIEWIKSEFNEDEWNEYEWN